MKLLDVVNSCFIVVVKLVPVLDTFDNIIPTHVVRLGATHAPT